MPLSLERYERLRALFDAAASVEPAERQAFIEAQTPDDGTLRAELKALLATGAATELPSRVPLSADTSPTPEAPARAPAPALGAPDLGVQVGHYRLLREIGRGGMGVVYLAARNDDVFSKVVALKVIGAGALDPEFVKRFRQERQILAGLDHPNIARILDGGDTPDGRPFYVMEHIAGVPIDAHCASAQADVRARLGLFRQVCLAVEHLHDKAVIHRDLKPSNVLVTPEGTVKLLDFGIARVQGIAGLASPVSSPGHQTMIMTPGYASPEQIDGREVDKPSDVYSLGVLLYQLLTGELPFGDDQGRPDVSAQLSGRAPVPPSRRGAMAARRSDRPPSTRQLRITADLDRVTLAALEKEPLLRYPSVRALREEIDRVLEGRPLASRSHQWVYRFRLFVGRNRMAAALAALLIIAVLTGGGIAVRNAIERARLEARAGELERFVVMLNARVERWAEPNQAVPVEEKLADVAGASAVLSSDALPALATRDEGRERADRLIGGVNHFLDRAANLAGEAELPVKRSIALTYRQAGDLQAGPLAPPGGERQQAVASYRRAAEVAVRAAPAEDPWVKAQLAELSGLLRGLGARLDAAGMLPSPAAPPEPVAEAVTTSAAPPPGARRASTPAAMGAPAAMDPAEFDELTRQIARVRVTAEQTRVNVADLRQRLESSGQVLRADIAAGMSRVESFLEAATRDLERRDSTGVRDNLQRASYALKLVGEAVGR
ncbi:MAG: protein kinase [Vicinamibacterales bacterium]